MNFLRILGACFLIAGVVALTDPVIRAAGIPWIVTGAVLVTAAQLMLRAQARAARLLATGRAGRATVLSVHDTGISLNKQPRVRLHVRIDVPGSPPVEATGKMFVSRVQVPRVGGVYPVRFDPERPDDFVFDPAASSPAAPAAPGSSSPTPASPASAASAAVGSDDPVGQIERLVALRDRGALTAEEFEAAKRAVLGAR